MLYKYLLIATIFSISLFAQREFDQRPLSRNERMEQLINSRLIKSLALDEETSIRFFSRRNIHQEKMRELTKKREGILRELNKQLKDEKGGYFSTIEASLNVENEIVAEKRNFITGLKEIMPEDKIATFIIFEMKLRKEVRKLIMDNRKAQRLKKNRRNKGF